MMMTRLFACVSVCLCVTASAAAQGIFPPFVPPTVDIFGPAVATLERQQMTPRTPPVPLPPAPPPVTPLPPIFTPPPPVCVACAPPPVCAPVPHRDVTAFDMTVSALIETPAPACDAHLMIFRAETQTAYLVDLRAWRYQVLPDYMPGHVFTAIEAFRHDPHHVLLKDQTGFWGWRWPVARLLWTAIP